jgi:mevalonate kinase
MAAAKTEDAVRARAEAGETRDVDAKAAGPRPARGRAFGHGKAILIGEHAVVYDQPALVAGLSLGVWADATDGTGTLSASGWQVRARAGDGTPLGQALAAILERLNVHDVDVRLEGDLPARAGLGSSAALAIAVARAVADARGLDAEAAWAAANAAEVVFHGTPSGIDLAAASTGQVGWFHRRVGWRPIAMPQSMTLCVGLSGRQRDTRAQVESVKRFRDRTPAVGKVIGALGDLVPACEDALAVGDVDEVGRLFDVAHGLLSALRVSSRELDTLVHVARAAGAVGAKLTGAGGGGAVIALAPGHEHDVLARWRNEGFSGFLAHMGPPPALPAHPRQNAGIDAGTDAGINETTTRATNDTSPITPAVEPRIDPASEAPA